MDYLLVSIDRLSGGIALCEDEHRRTHRLLLSLLPAGAREGDCLRLYADGHTEADEEETQRRKERIKALQNKLFTEE
ncbi:MAG: DUF3006 domain-containing protein [Acetanaerobacterium sp.]